MRFPFAARRPPHSRELPVADVAQGLFWAWALLAVLAGFVGVWLWQRGLWFELLRGDPSGISAGIVVISLIVTGWCGWRAARIAREALPEGAWRQAYAADVRQGLAQAPELLSERAHGVHETAWWFAATAIKLGLLGTVVGFIVMSSTIGQMPSFELDQVQDMLKRMTQGMAIALYTTLVGLIANLWLGLQLLLLDRMSDRVVADILGGTPR